MFKKFLAVIALALVLGGSALAFAWWDNLSANREEVITIGQGVTLQVAAVATAPEGKVLVPAGVVLKANDVTEVVLTYNVKLDLEVLTALDLTVSASNIQIGGSSEHEALVTIDIAQAAATVNNADVLVTVTITLAQPDTEEVYLEIINQDITFTLTFSASQ